MDSSIHFVITGGTIDSHWQGNKDTITPNEHSVIPAYTQGLNLGENLEFSEVCMKDSRELNQEDLKKILDTVESSDHDKVIITHGTYTMPDTARYLKANLKRQDQTIILTGSMSPLTGFDKSDAAFNLGFAVSKLQDLNNGIFLAMNGQVFSPDEVIKLVSAGKFTSIFQNKQ